MSELAQRFRRFAQRECDASPLYRRLAEGVADAPDLLAIAATGGVGPKPNLFLAAVQYLLLQDHEADCHADDRPPQRAESGNEKPIGISLSDFYPTVSHADPPPGDPYPFFHAFCLRHEKALRHLMTERLVQTNEVNRSAVLFAAYGWLAPRLEQRPLALIELGTSAGLLLLWDKYRYDYGDGSWHGALASPVAIRCLLRGAVRPPLLDAQVNVVSRTGIDLSPVDPRDADEAMWLQALVWGDQRERAERLRGALSVALQEPPKLVPGDALQELPAVLGAVPAGVVPLVFHSHTLNQLTPDARAEFHGLLSSQSRERDIWHISMEWLSGGEWPELEVSRYSQGTLRERHTLARYGAHGDWLEWTIPAAR